MDAKRTCLGCGKPLAPDVPLGLCPECLIKGGFPSGADSGSDLGGEARSAFVPPAVEELARFFPQLQILELIGKGGMGAVYKARQKELDRVVALKILPPGIGDDPAFAERFAREAKALAKLNHPGIVTLYEFGRTDGLFYFLMEFVDGVNLRQLLRASRVAPREALAIVPEICDALQYAHDQGIVHRDIKPENILLDRRGRVKVADFGLARLMGMEAAVPGAAGGPTAPASFSLTESGKVMGTPQYMAPEQRDRPMEVDHRADIYSLGVVLYQMLTGELPGKPIEPPSRKVHLDVRLDEVVLRALEKEPERRYQQASQVKTAVETIATKPADEPAQPPAPEPGALFKLSPFPRLNPGERVLHFKPCLWRMSGKSLPSYRLFFSLPPLWMAALYVTDCRLILMANAFGFINQEFSMWFRGEAQAKNREVFKTASVGRNAFGSYLEVLSAGGGKHWYRSDEAQLRFYGRDSAALLKVILAAAKGENLPPITEQQVRLGAEAGRIRARWVSAALWVIAGLCLLNFVLPHSVNSSGPSPAIQAFGGTQPWLRWSFHPHPDRAVEGVISRTVERVISFNPHSSAFLSGIAGLIMALLIAFTRRRTVLHLKTARLAAPSPPAQRLEESNLAKVRRALKAPASWLVATGILNWIGIPFVVMVILLTTNRSSSERPTTFLVLLAGLVLSSAMIAAGLSMKRLEAYSLAITGSILATFMTPGNIIGLPVGIWCLVVLSRHDVREAFVKADLLLHGSTDLNRGSTGITPPPAASEQPRFSRLAIIGTVWAIAGVVLAAISAAYSATVSAAGRPTRADLLIQIPLAVIYLSAPFGTTILGWAAVSQIRRSGGKLCGLGLALFDGLFFPLLALDAALLAVGSAAALPILSWVEDHLWKAYNLFAVGFDVALLALIGGIDWWICRRVWRAVRKPASLSGQHAPQSEPSPHQPPSARGSSDAHPWSGVQARFSRAAIAGAVWVAFFFAIVPAFVAHEVQTHEFWRNGPFGSVLGALVFFVFLLPACIAPVSATLLGWIAVTQIRHSAGRLYGLGLAVFDGLLFPLLALDFFLLVLTTNLIPDSLGDALYNTLVILGMIGFGLLNFWIVRRAWGVVKRPAGDGTTTPAALHDVAPLPKTWLAVAGAVTAIILLPIFLMVTTTFKQQPALKLALPEPTQAKKTGANEAPPLMVTIDAEGKLRLGPDTVSITLERLKEELVAAVARKPGVKLAISADKAAPISQVIKVMEVAKEANITALVRSSDSAPRPSAPAGFGPVEERVINQPAVGLNCFLNLTTAKLLTPPPDIARFFAAGDWMYRYEEDTPQARKAQDWVRAAHADLVANREGNEKGVALFDGFAVASFSEGAEQNGAEYWSMDAAQLVDLLHGFQKQVGGRVVLPSIADPTMRAGLNELPRSFAFKTGDSREGVLELLGITENPPGVRIRYKVVNAEMTAPTSSSLPHR